MGRELNMTLLEILLVEINHECKMCGRPLSDPFSQKVGFGPICYEKHRLSQALVLLISESPYVCPNCRKELTTLQRTVTYVCDCGANILNMSLIDMITRQDLTCASFFSGIGGMDRGFKEAGYRTLWANEVDPHQASIFRSNFPKVPMLEESIHLLSSNDLMDTYGVPDVLHGGFPCVTYSKAAGIHGKRWTDTKPKTNYKKYAADGGDLFLHMRRMIGDIQPKAFLIENVTDMAGCRIVMETLKNTPCSISGKRLGRYYTFHFGEVNTKDFGLAQNRKRMFVVGLTKEAKRPVLEKQPIHMRHIVGEILEEEPDVAPLNGDVMPQYIQNRIDGKYRDKPSIKTIDENCLGNTCVAHYATDQSTTMVQRADGRLTPYSIREYARLQGFADDFILPSSKKTYRGIGNAVSVPVSRAFATKIAALVD